MLRERQERKGVSREGKKRPALPSSDAKLVSVVQAVSIRATFALAVRLAAVAFSLIALI